LLVIGHEIGPPLISGCGPAWFRRQDRRSVGESGYVRPLGSPYPAAWSSGRRSASLTWAMYWPGFSPMPFGRLTARGSRPSAFFSACLSQPTGFQSAVALTSTAMSGVFSTSAPGLPAPVEVAHGQPCARRYSATSAWVFMPLLFLCWLIVGLQSLVLTECAPLERAP